MHVLYTMYCVLYTVYHVLCIMHYILCTIHYTFSNIHMLYTHYIPYKVLHADSVLGYHRGAKDTIYRLLLSKLGGPSDAGAVALGKSIQFVELEAQQQDNGFDCGVFCLENMRLLISAVMSGGSLMTFGEDLQLTQTAVTDKRVGMRNQMQRAAELSGRSPVQAVSAIPQVKWNSEQDTNVWVLNGTARNYSLLTISSAIVCSYHWSKNKTMWIEVGRKRPLIHHQYDFDVLFFANKVYFAGSGLSHYLYGTTHILLLMALTTQSKPAKVFWVYDIRNKVRREEQPHKHYSLTRYVLAR
jgi:hypothetical protein